VADVFEVDDSRNGFSLKLWRGERMCLLGFDVDHPEPDFVGFAIECKSPGSSRFEPLRNRLAFSSDKPVTGARQFSSKEAPFQKFRWIHFPKEPKAGTYQYRATKMHMPTDGTLVAGTSITLPIPLDPVTYADFLDVGFTRNFASSQAYAERFKNDPDIIPSNADEGLTFTKKTGDMYDWLGFEAHALIFDFLQSAVADPAIEVDLFAFDLNEPDIVRLLEQLGPRLRAIIDDSTTTKKGVKKGHGADESTESKAAARLAASAGADRVKRCHFNNLQHHKVLIARRGGVPFKVLLGSTNFSFRGLYIQANNVLVFQGAEVAGFVAQVFDVAFAGTKGFKANALASQWHPVSVPGKPKIQLCFSPHSTGDLSLAPVRDAINGASSSVLYSVAFLNQIASGPTKEAFDALITRPLFSYGVADEAGQLQVKKPDGSVGLVEFAFLSKNAPEPFKSEWSGGGGINIHHKFVVTDFNLPSAKLFTGSSNLAVNGETGNGDHLILIEDCRVAAGYAIEALRMFDHLHFRVGMKEAAAAPPGAKPPRLTLRKPIAISHEAKNWFDDYYVPGSQRETDRLLFSHSPAQAGVP